MGHSFLDSAVTETRRKKSFTFSYYYTNNIVVQNVTSVNRSSSIKVSLYSNTLTFKSLHTPTVANRLNGNIFEPKYSSIMPCITPVC